MTYSTEFSINLIPRGSVSPHIKITVGDYYREMYLENPLLLSFSMDFDSGPQKFILEFDNKVNDSAVEIGNVEFEGMTLDRFKWSSRYYPVYPEPWVSEQLLPLPEYQESATYLGWNGRWELYFETPIFTWIHRLENLGWIYN